MKESYDVVVIGSGFGGAINACRFAHAGADLSASSSAASVGARKSFRARRDRSRGSFWNYKDLGLLDYRAFENIDVIQASGVSGGSLVYFNVHLRTPKEIFENPRWPKGVKRDILDPFYDKARDMLEARALTPPADFEMPPRTQAFKLASNPDVR